MRKRDIPPWKNLVHGHLDVRSFHSDISLHNCSGSARLYSCHGNLQVDLNSIDSRRPLDFQSYNGSIDVTLPADVSANTRLRTGRGKSLTDFDITETGDPVKTESGADGTKNVAFDKYVGGTINGGGATLTIETGNGDIRILKRIPKTDESPGREEAGQNNLQP